MKLTIQKIFFSILAMAVSIAAAVIGMYMIFLAEMVFGYRLLFSAIFMFNPILTGFLISFVFRKQEAKQPKEPKESRWGSKRKDKEEPEAVADYSAPTPQPTAYTPPQPAGTTQTGTFSDTPAAESQSTTQNTSGYDLPGSEVYTGYEDTVNAGDVTSAESTKADVSSKLKFWERSAGKGEDE